MNDWWTVLHNEILLPLALPTTLVLLAVVVRSARVLRFRCKQGGFPPIIIHAADDIRSHAFAARLSEFLAREAPGPTVIIPPGSGAPQAPVSVGLSSPGGWLAALSSIAFSREPAFDVNVELPEISTQEVYPRYQAIIRITRVPGNSVLAADSLDVGGEKALIERAGCLIIYNVRQQSAAVRHTPRWERWSQDSEGYYLYRRALDSERNGEREAALNGYDEALRHEPGSFLITIRKAALLEGMGEFKKAAETYRTCYELWPQHIESGYRLAASYANGKDLSVSQEVLNSIKKRLKVRILWGEWGKTWWLTRWNVGERHYWRSLSRRRPPIFGSSDRYHLFMAVRVATQVRGISLIVFPESNDDEAEIEARDAEAKVEIDRLVGGLANLTTRGALSIKVIKWALGATKVTGWAPGINKMITWASREISISAYIRLFHPEQLTSSKRHDARRSSCHCTGWHEPRDDKNLVMYPLKSSAIPRRFRGRKRIGWLAHYNAACFYSLALLLEENRLPFGYEIEAWKTDCTRAAIRELGHVRRDPLNRLEPEWYRSDPELRPLTDRVKGTRWAKLVGLGDLVERK
jgi:tetratricopeptide (TPR) repeat protein